MNYLIYAISIIIVICILYHLRENIINLFRFREGFFPTNIGMKVETHGVRKSGEPLNLTGKSMRKLGRCANYKVRGKWVRDGQYSSCGNRKERTMTTLKECANMFGEKGGVFSYNYKNGGCLYTKTNDL